MPELPEVETVCRVMRRVLTGTPIERVLAVSDPIVFGRTSAKALQRALVGRVVTSIGRRGKYFWLNLRGPGRTVFGHLGMSGWIRDLGHEGARLHGHRGVELDDAAGRPRFLKLLLTTRGGGRIAFIDPRRLGRIWLGGPPEDEPRVKRLGRDAFDDLPRAPELLAMFGRRQTAIKAVLLDQTVLAGIGNWIADEVLYQSRIAPKRIAASLTESEGAALRRAIRSVLVHAVKVGADYRRFPKTWLFEHRWGGARGPGRVHGEAVVRESIGGRTTAWVPSRQH